MSGFSEGPTESIVVMRHPDSQRLLNRLVDIYAAWERSRGSDASQLVALFADDIQLFSIADGRPGLAFTAACRSKAEAELYLAGLMRDWELQALTIEDTIVEAGRVVLLYHASWTNRHTGKLFETAKVDIWRFRNGRAVEFREFYDSAGALAAASPGPAPDTETDVPVAR